MKKSILFLLLFFSFHFVFAQNELLVQSNEKGLFINHTVSSGQNFYSIGRLFNVTAKEIASFNGLDMNKGLTIGQELKIPLNAKNFNQKNSNGRAVYYVVGPAEGLYRVSLKNNKVLMANIRKWNSLKSDNINTGQKLVVGYLVSPEANNIVVQAVPEPEKKVVSEEPKKDVAVQQQNPVEHKQVEKDVEIKKTADEPPPPPPVSKPVSTAPTQVAVTDGSGGYFRSQFEQQVRVQPIKKDETASAGIFKTSSGWQDAKYYALMDGVDPGTIIKVVNPTNNKTIYAKVLGEMSGIRQNQGYDVRISNAAASALDVSDMDKFIVRVNY
jgi:LysM repeat protein